jgi:outer membrane protein assembly complex protein YaeT
VNRAAEAVFLLAALSAVRLPAQQVPPPERTVLTVNFDGNHAVDDLSLAAAISTSGSSWTYRMPIIRSLGIGTRHALDETELRRDVLRLALYYRQRGYYEARIDTVVRRGTDAARIRFRITEGPPTLVDSVDLRGLDDTMLPAGLRNGLPLQPGQPFDRLRFAEASDSLVAALRDRGYAFATVFRNYSVDRRTRLARVEYEILAGPRVRVGQTVVEGLERVAPRTVRRRLAFREGGWYSRAALLESQRRLYQSDLFRFVNVGVAPDSLLSGSDTLLRVRVQVAEAPPRDLRVGAGYGTIDCFRASGQATLRNFLGEARALDLSGRVSKLGAGAPLDLGMRSSLCPELINDPFSVKLNYDASVGFTQPAFFAHRATLTVGAFAQKRSEFRAYLIESQGASFGVRYGVRSNLPVTLAYRLSRERTTAEPATYCIYFDQCDPVLLDPFRQTLTAAAVTLAASRTATDAPLEPTRGTVVSAEATVASRALGSDVVFARAVGEAAGYLPLGRRSVLALRLRGGLIRAGRSTIGDSILRYVPPQDRFYAGGPGSVRGFGRNLAGPVVYVADSQRTDGSWAGLRSSPTGSAALVLANAELRVPTPIWGGRIALAAYADAARLWQQQGDRYTAGRIVVTPGMGVQIGTPLGPMRLDAAYNAYGPQSGPLYRIVGADLVLADPDFKLPPGATFFSRLHWAFSVGLAF